MQDVFLRCNARFTVSFCLAASLSLGACGPRIFSDTMPFPIQGTPPAPVVAPEPPPPPPRVEVIDNKIVIHEKIQFEYDKAVILEQSFDLLAEIAATIQANSHIHKIRIEGHASAEGSDSYNLKLSDERAKAVMAHLIETNGVDATILIAKGFGETQPIASNDDDAGRERNRRVEFVILEQDVTEKKVHVDTKTGETKVVEEQVRTVKHPTANDEGSEPAETSQDPSNGLPDKKGTTN